MTWSPAPRPAWVRAVNAGDVVPMTTVARLPLTRQSLLGEAMLRAGLSDFGADDFHEALEVLLPALADEASLTVLGRWLTRRFLLRLLTVRLQLVEYTKREPGVRDEPIAEPLFVTGAPRTGTTLLYGALAADERHRAPMGWEFLWPVPFGDEATRVALADDELRGPATVVDGLDAIHVYGGRMPKECLSAMSFALRSEEFTARYHVPSYAAWLATCDMRPAYEMHKLVLQVLQHHEKGDRRRWVLKSPVHLHSLPTLLAVYPDASVVVTHRDPLAMLASVTSLVAALRWAHSDAVGFRDIGAFHAERYWAALDGLVDAPLDQAGAMHLRYAELARDPAAAVASVYERFGWSLPPATPAAPAKDAYGVHEYSFADLGLDRNAERARYARYQAHFGVPDE
jgi:hypothetical protein